MDAYSHQTPSPSPLQKLITLTLLLIGGTWLAFSALKGHVYRGKRSGKDVRTFRADQYPLNSNDLRLFIVGTSKDKVVARLGPPRAIGGVLSADSRQGSPQYFDANTWYYPLQEDQHSAIAVVFAGEVAREVEILEVATGGIGQEA